MNIDIIRSTCYYIQAAISVAESWERREDRTVKSMKPRILSVAAEVVDGDNINLTDSLNKETF